MVSFPTDPAVERRTVATPAGPVALLEAGAGRPVLFVPGYTGTKEDFVAVLPLLAGPDGFTGRPAATGRPVTTVSAGSAVPGGAALSRIGRLVLAAGDGQVVAYG